MKSLKYLLFAVIIFVTNFAHAKPTVILLTSFENPHTLWQTESPLINNLENIFRKTYADSGYNIVVKHKASAYDLWNALHSPENIGVFWMSHAAPKIKINDSINFDGVINTINGGNVRSLFNHTHPNLRWLGIIACNSHDAIGVSGENQITKTNNLTTLTFHELVRPEQGLRKALKMSNAILGRGDHIWSDNSFCILDGSCIYTKKVQRIKARDEFIQRNNTITCPIKKGVPIIIKRTIPSNIPKEALTSISITLDDNNLLTLFPPGNPGDIQQTTVYLPMTSLKNHLTIKVEADGSMNRDPKPYLGGIDFQASWIGASWKVFSVKSVPVGTIQNIYSYTGLATIDAPEVEHRPFECYSDNAATRNCLHCNQTMPNYESPNRLYNDLGMILDEIL